jgi:hypothetical protein
LVDPRDWNQPLPGTGDPTTWLPFQQRRPLYAFRPLVTQVSGTDSSATSDYHSLQVSARKRLSGGFEFLGSYTLSKTITDNLGYYGSGGVNAPSAYWMNAYDRRQDRGLSFFDATHNFVWSGTYDLPIGKGRAWGTNWNGVVNAILGGWNLSNIVSLHTGFPVTIRQNRLVGVSDSIQDPRGGERPNRIAGSSAVAPNQGPDQWLIGGTSISSAYVPNGLGTFGNAGNSSERAPGFANWDLGIGKKFNLTERHYLDFRAEFFNFTNHPSFSPPSNNISDPNNFGKIFGTVSPPRIMEFALKYYF